MFVHPPKRTGVAAGCAVGLALLGSSAVAARHSAGAAARPSAPRWLVADTTRHTATVAVIAGYTGANDGLNFDGDADGKLVIRIPVGYRVTIAFASKGAFPHNAVITPSKPTETSNAFPLAFPGSGPTDTTAGVIVARYTFRATTAGAYYLVCGLPGHAATGMWGRFMVTRGGRPSITL